MLRNRGADVTDTLTFQVSPYTISNILSNTE